MRIIGNTFSILVGIDLLCSMAKKFVLEMCCCCS
jgi:hypothetical protein